MNSPRFYCAKPLVVGDCVDLPEAAARHAVKALRLRLGDGLTLFDGAGGEYACRMALIERSRVAVDVLAWTDVEREAPHEITLVQALQSGDKMDLTVQKAVELGVARVVPVMARRSVLRLEGERAARRVAHWQGVASAACEQCGRNRLPQIEEISTLEAWLRRPVAPDVLRLLLAPNANGGLQQLTEPARGAKIEVLIGAEGGLAPEEMDAALQAGFVAVQLGPRVLRTETAGLVALTAIQCLWGDFKKGE